MINLSLHDCHALVELFHAAECSVEVCDTNISIFRAYKDLPRAEQKYRTQKALIFSVLEIHPDYHVAAVWMPECEVFASDFAIIHVEEGKITKAQITDGDTPLYPINIDDPDSADAILSVGYSLFSNDPRPVAKWFTAAPRSEVSHRVAHAIKGMKGEYHLGSR